MSVAKIDTAELNAAKNFSTFEDLSTNATESSNMKGLIDSFIYGSKGKLKGEVWNVVNGELSQFSSALSQQMELANHLSEAIQKALDILINYAGDEYASLDCSDLPELKTNRQKCLNNIDDAKAMISSLSKAAESSGEDNSSNINYYYGLLNTYQTELSELDKLIEKLEGLKEKYNEAKAILDAAFAEVTQLSNDVSNISVGKQVNFIAN